MKIAGKVLATLFILLFLWIMFITITPIKPSRPGAFFACEVNNFSSWETSGGDLVMSSVKSLKETSKSHMDFFFQHPPVHDGLPYFLCKFPIPEMILYKAVTINVTYKLNQPAFFDVGLRRVGQGPGWEPVKIDSDQVNQVITSTWLLHSPEQPKINWLSGSYEGVTFGVNKFDRSKELRLTIYRVYLE